jgi:hypothetical protein
VKRCTCSILFQETLWREKARVLGVILIDTRKQTQRERERERVGAEISYTDTRKQTQRGGERERDAIF